MRIFLLFAMFVLASCAFQNGGQIDPIWILTKEPVLAIDAQVYYNQATQHCNVEAAKNYRTGMFICANPGATAAQLPQIGWGVTTAEVVDAIALVCNRGGFIPSPTLPSVVQVQNCPTAVEPLAPLTSLPPV